MKKNLLLLVFIQLLLLLSPVFAVAQQPPVGTPDSVGMSSERLDRLEPAQREITIRDLLTHTAGISYGAGATDSYR